MQTIIKYYNIISLFKTIYVINPPFAIFWGDCGKFCDPFLPLKNPFLRSFCMRWAQSKVRFG